MQPYFFPYLGHFSLIAHTDAWVVFDVTQYTPKTWMNRNRVLHPKSGWNYVTVPLANSSQSIKTCEARVLDPQGACRSVLGKLSHYRHKAPYAREVEELVRHAFGAGHDDSLVQLNTRALEIVCTYIGLPFRYRVCSELKLALPEGLPAGGWALEICAQLGADEYLNPIGGRELFEPVAWRTRGIGLKFLATEPWAYATGPFAFEPGLSMLDVLMWNAPDQVLAAVRSLASLVEPD